MQKKHLVIVFWNLGTGGIQKRIAAIIKYLLVHNNDVTITLLLKTRNDKVNIIEKNERLSIRYFSNQQDVKGKRLLFGIWLIIQLMQENPTHILTFLYRFSIFVSIYKLLTKIFGKHIKVILSEEIHTSTYIHQNPLIKVLISFFYKHVDEIIVLNKTCKEDLIKNFSLHKERIKIIPPWNLNIKNNNHFKKIYDYIFIGRLHHSKNIDTFLNFVLEVRRDFPNLRFAIAGDGEEREYVEKIINLNKLSNTTYLGNTKNVMAVLKMSKILILPSQNEGVPTVVLEAASLAIPSIVANFCGASELIIQGKTGWIFHTREELRSVALLVITKNRLRTEVGNAARKEFAVTYSEKNLDQFCKHII